MDATFKDIIDIYRLQQMMDKFYRATQIPIGIIDVDGNILVATGWQEICVKFHRANPKTEQRCLESDNYLKQKIHEGKYIQYKCKNGLWDIAIPIIVAEQHMANLFVGQFFYEDEQPDIDFFKNQAVEYGFDVDEYLQALENIKFFSREKIRDIMDYYSDFASFISELAYNNLQLKNDIKQLEGIIPICSYCKKIRDDKGYWSQVEEYVAHHTEAQFSHGICSDCENEVYKDMGLEPDD